MAADAALGAGDWAWQAASAVRTRRARGVFMVGWGWFFRLPLGGFNICVKGSLKWS